MKKLLVALCFTCALILAVHAEDGDGQKAKGKKHAPLTAEQKALRKEILEKYDTNKDGKLDKEERAKISDEDKDKMEKAGLMGAPKHKKKKAE